MIHHCPPVRSTRLAAVAIALAVSAVSGCCKKAQDSGDSAGSTATTPASGARAGDLPAPDATGPVVRIPAGTLVAGTPCQQIPRITNEELEGVRLELGAFDIDVYPYPNDPSKPPATGVSRDEADRLCRARGRRLCTELEWERACKGPSNYTYPYGNAYKTKVCDGSSSLLRNAGSYDSCASEFGVKALFGAVWEWTSSEWGRGGAGGLATVRGGGAKNPTLQSRCANGQGRSPADSAADVGFRCCGGDQNTVSVNLSLDSQPILTAEAAVDSTLSSRLLSVLPASMRNVPGFDVSLDRVWRWHPRANEELLVVRYVAKKAAPAFTFYRPLVYHLCGSSTVLSSKLRGPVARMFSPAAGADPQQISLQVETGTDKGEVQFTYRYGAVAVKNPDWVKEGDSMDPPGATPPRLIVRPPPIRKK